MQEKEQRPKKLLLSTLPRMRLATCGFVFFSCFAEYNIGRMNNYTAGCVLSFVHDPVGMAGYSVFSE